MPEKKKNKGGRPTKWDPKLKPTIKMLYRKGCSDKEVAKALMIDPQTLYNWKKRCPKFFESLNDWKLKADADVERSLYERAKGYSHPEDKIFCDSKTGETTVVPTVKHYPPDSTAIIYWLKNRQPKRWRDKQEIEHSGEQTIKVLPPPEWGND